MDTFWEPNGHAPHPVKYESDAAVSGFSYCNENGLNFSASTANYSEDDADFAPGGRRGKASRQDPLSHRIIEKRRRDRMNSCLADLSRLIPTQYQRKGRGRIEKTEIIEMSIRYMKQLQNQELNQKETAYKMGYEDCLKRSFNFLCGGHQDICLKLMEHLKEHSTDFFKAELFKHRTNVNNNNIDAISASSGSPPAHHLNGYHSTAPLNQLRDMLTTSSDMEHSNSADHNDIKDLSFRAAQPQQAPVITSTAPASVHLDTSSNHEHDFDSSRASSAHGGSVIDGAHHESVLRNVRVCKLSDPCHEHNEHSNSYKFKNYIQQRFSQDTTNGYHVHHDDTSHSENNGYKSPSTASSTSAGNVVNNGAVMSSSAKKAKLSPEYTEGGSSCDERPTTNGITDIKQEVIYNNVNGMTQAAKPNQIIVGNGVPVPIFALHAQGRFYVPLTVDYESLLPYMGSVDLIEKYSGQMMPPLHAININVNFNPVSSRLKMSSCMGTQRNRKDTMMYGQEIN